MCGGAKRPFVLPEGVGKNNQFSALKTYLDKIIALIHQKQYQLLMWQREIGEGHSLNRERSTAATNCRESGGKVVVLYRFVFYTLSSGKNRIF